MGSSGPSNQQVTQTNLPEYARPYYTDLMDRATDLSLGDYTPYEGQRLAGQAADTLTAYDNIRNMGPITGLDEAMGATAYNVGATQGIANDAYAMGDTPYDPYQFSAYKGFSRQQFNPYSGFNQYNFGNAQQWTDEGVAESYMSPYIENVLDVQKERQLLDFDRMQGQRDATAVQQGAFGGSRSAVVNALAQEQLSRQMAETDAMGLQQAYESGLGAFNQDRMATLGYGQAQAGERARVQGGRAAELGRVQAGRADERARVQQARAEERARVQQSQAAEDMRAAQFDLQAQTQGMDTALQALAASGQQAGQLAQLGGAEREAAVEQAQLLERAGEAQQAYEQAGLDIGFDDFLRQQGFAESQLQMLNSILRGVPVGPSQTTTTYTPNDPMGDLLGAGISLVGMNRALS